MTVTRPIGTETDTSFRLCVRAPRIRRTEEDGEEERRAMGTGQIIRAGRADRRLAEDLLQERLQEASMQPALLGRRGALDEDLGQSRGARGRRELPGLGIDVGGDDVRRYREARREELRRKRLREVR